MKVCLWLNILTYRTPEVRKYHLRMPRSSTVNWHCQEQIQKDTSGWYSITFQLGYTRCGMLARHPKVQKHRTQVNKIKNKNSQRSDDMYFKKGRKQFELYFEWWLSISHTRNYILQRICGKTLPTLMAGDCWLFLEKYKIATILSKKV